MSFRSVEPAVSNFEFLDGGDPSLIEVPFGEAVAGLSTAVDLSMGRRPGHARATAALGVRLAARLGLGERQIRELALAALLKDAG